YRRREFEIDLALPKHAADLFRRVMPIRLGDVEQDRRILIRILHAHAAMAERAFFPGEQMLVRRIVLIDQELVREIETDAAERVSFAGRLRNMDAAVARVLEP